MTASQQNRDRYALIGHPIAHSLSPTIHNTSFQALGLNAVYDLVDSSERGLAMTVDYLVQNNYRGWNVTMPDKTAICSYLDELSDESKIGNAVNTVINKNGRLIGTTTDGAGFLYALKTADCSVKDASMTLLGGGGASASILIASALAGVSTVDIFCRSLASKDRMLTICDRLKAYTASRLVLHDFADTESLTAALNKNDILANATNVGMGPTKGKSPLGDLRPQKDSLVFDAIYHPMKTQLLIDAENAGCRIVNGLPMLIGQAAESFRLWTGLAMPIDSLPTLF